MTKKDLTVGKNTYGQIIISTIINNQRIHRQYFGYTKNDAINNFLNEFKENK